MISRLPHQVYYLIELLILLGGFYTVYRLAGNYNLQEGVFVGVLVVYTLFGIYHHKLHHTLRMKIVIEYILVSTLILACFLMLHI